MAQTTQPSTQFNDAAADYQNYRNATNDVEIERALNAEFGITEDEVEAQTPLEFVNPDTTPATPLPTADARVTLSKGTPSLRETVARNITEIPIQSGGGAVDAFNEALKFTDAVGEALTKIGLPSSFLQIKDPTGKFDVRFLSPSEKELAEAAGLLEIPQLPAPGEADTPTGAIAREIAQFLTGFIPAVKGAKALSAAAKLAPAGKVGKAGLQAIESASAAAISAAVARDPHEARLSTFLNDVPWLSDIVPDYLADNNAENETEWEGRLKNAIDEAGFGVLVDGLISSFKFYKAQRKAKRIAREEMDVFDKERLKQEELQASVLDADAVSEQDLAGLGDPNSDELFIPADVANARIEEALKRVDVDEAATKAAETVPTTALAPRIPGKLVGSRVIDFGFGDNRLLLEFDSSAEIPSKKDLELLINSLIGNKNLVIRQISKKRGGFSATVGGFDKFEIQFEGITKEGQIIPTPQNETDIHELLDELTGGTVSEKTAKEIKGQPKPRPKITLPEDARIEEATKRVEGGPQIPGLNAIDTGLIPKKTKDALVDSIPQNQSTNIQWQRNKEGGQLFGNQERFINMTPQLYKRFGEPIFRIPFEQFKKEFPDRDVIIIGKTQPENVWEGRGISDKKEARRMISDRVEDKFSTKVESLDSDKAIKQGLTADSDVGKTAPSQAPKITLPEDQIFINFARIDAPEDVKKLLQDVANADAEAINIKRRGKVSNKQTIRESKEKFQQLGDLLGRDPGPMSAAEAVAARKVLNSSASQLLALAKVANSPTAGPADLFAFRRAMSVHYAIQSEVIAARTETARALQSWSIVAGTDKQRGEAIAQALSSASSVKFSMAGTGSTKKLAKIFTNIGENQTGLNLAATQYSRPKFPDVAYQYWINSILSGPTTQIVNVLGNGINAAYVIPRKMVDATVSKLFYDGEISYLETTSQAVGMAKGFRNGFRMLWHANKAADIGDLKAQFEQFSKVEGVRKNLISAETFGVGPGSAFGRGIDYLGKAVNLPTSILGKVDTLFKSIAYSGEVQSQAVREGLSQGLEGRGLAEFVTKFANDPPLNIKAEAMNVADVMTFTNQVTGKVGETTRAIRNIPGVRWIAPFARTPTNILATTFKGTPLAFLSTQVKADIAAGGVRAAQAWGAIGAGTMTMMSATDMALEGTITGKGPKDPRLRKNLLRTGWKAYSARVVIDGETTYIPFNRLDPIGNFFAFGADLAEVINNIDDADSDFMVTTLITGFYENLKSKTWLQGVTSVMGALDPATHSNDLERWATGFGASFLPNLLRQTTRATDPTLKTTRTSAGDPRLTEGVTGVVGELTDTKTAIFMRETIDELRSRVPGFGEGIPLRRDLWGREITRASGYGWAFDLLSPVYASVEKPDHIESILIDNEIPVSHVSNKIQGVELTSFEYDDYAKLSGELLREEMEKLVQAGRFKSSSDGPDGMKSHLIQKLVNKVRNKAKLEFRLQNPKLNERIRERENLRRQNLSEGNPSDKTAGMPALPMATDGRETAGDASLETILGGR